MISFLLVVQVPDASDMRRMPVTFRPCDRFVLRLERGEDMVGMVFNDIVVDMTPLGAPFWTRLNVDGRHALYSP
jgi:hypothetical protein